MRTTAEHSEQASPDDLLTLGEVTARTGWRPPLCVSTRAKG